MILFSSRMFRTLASNLKLSSLDLVPEAELPVEEEEEEEDIDKPSSPAADSGNDEF
jgi:hypothetical protein